MLSDLVVVDLRRALAGPHAAMMLGDRRVALGEDEATRRLLGATGTSTYLLETGYLGDQVLDPRAHAQASTAQVREVVRLETVAEDLLSRCGSAEEFVADYPAELTAATVEAVGTKSIIGYRHGFDLPADRLDRQQVVAAARAVLDSTTHPPRLSDPVVLRFLLWCGALLGVGGATSEADQEVSWSDYRSVSE